MGPVQKSAVVGDQDQRAAVAQCEPKDPSIGSIEDASADDGRFNGCDGVEGPVDQSFRSHESLHHGRSHGIIDRDPVRPEAAVLEDQGELALQGREVQPTVLIGVLHDQQAANPLIRMSPREMVGMGVVPVGPPAVRHGEVVRVVFARSHGEARVSVHVVGGSQTMPVENQRIVNPILHAHAEGLSPLDAQQRGRELSLHEEMGRNRPPTKIPAAWSNLESQVGRTKLRGPAEGISVQGPRAAGQRWREGQRGGGQQGSGNRESSGSDEAVLKELPACPFGRGKVPKALHKKPAWRDGSIAYCPLPTTRLYQGMIALRNKFTDFAP